MKEKSTKSTSKTNWDRLNQMDDQDIDFSDIAVTNEDFWAEANVVLPETKSRISIRLDNDVLDWFKSKGKGYQTKINAVLKSYVDAHR